MGGLSSKSLSTEEWKGKDLLGQLLENTREALKGARRSGMSLNDESEVLGALSSSDDEEDYY